MSQCLPGLDRDVVPAGQGEGVRAAHNADREARSICSDDDDCQTHLNTLDSRERITWSQFNGAHWKPTTRPCPLSLTLPPDSGQSSSGQPAGCLSATQLCLRAAAGSGNARLGQPGPTRPMEQLVRPRSSYTPYGSTVITSCIHGWMQHWYSTG
jgi:hypothetical protein